MLLKNVRIAFPHLWQPHAFDANAEAKYQTTVIVPKDHPQYDEVVALHESRRKEAFGALKVPGSLRDGAEYAGKVGFDDSVVFFVPKSKTRVPVFDRDRTPLVEGDGRIYPGCRVNVSFDFYTTKQPSKRVNAGLNGIQFWADDEAFGGGVKASAEDFPEYDEADDDFLAVS